MAGKRRRGARQPDKHAPETPRVLSAVPDMRLYTAADLRKIYIPSALPQSENYRTYYGKSTDLGRIEAAIRNADHGVMHGLCDLESEALTFDPHLSGVASKRFGQIRGLDWDTTPAQGPDIDDDLAEHISECTTSAFKYIPQFMEHLYLLAWSMYDGRAAGEIHWEERAYGRPRWNPAALGWVHPRRLSFGPSRELRIVDTWQASGYFAKEGLAVAELPGKFISITPRLFREYPEREGFGPRTLYWAFFKRFSWRFRMALTELFGLPWRIITPQKGANVNSESLDNAKESAERLGGESTAVMDNGLSLDVVFPGGDSGNLFAMTSGEVDAQMSKLVLWQTGTTDGGSNRAESIVHKGEQDLLLQIDAMAVSEAIQAQLVIPYVSLNWGADVAATHAPKFQLRADPVRDRMKEIERTEKVISLGLPVAVAELQEMAGVRTPGDNEAYVTGSALMGYRVVDPEIQRAIAEASGDSPAEIAADPTGSGQQIPLGVDAIGWTTTVNEARASNGLGPMLRADGSPDPDGSLFIAVYQAKVQAQLQAASMGLPAPQAAASPPPPAAPGTLAPEPMETEGTGQLTDDIDDELDAAEEEATALVRAAFAHIVPQVLSYGDPGDAEFGDEATLLALAGLLDGEDEDEGGAIALGDDPRVLVAPRRRDDPEVELVERGAREAARATESIVAGFIKAVPESGDAAKAWRAISRAASRLNMDRFARIVEQTSMRSMMLGAVQADWEATNDKTLAPATFAGAGGAQAAAKAAEDATLVVKESVYGNPGEVFVRRPFEAAVRDFASRQVLTKQAFARMAAANRRRSFTIANMAKRAMIEVAHSELTTAIKHGTDLRKFRSKLANRFTAAGWTPMNSSRVELVFRNATASANANGRHAQMTQPHVLAERPYWQITGPKDERKRPTHAAAMGKVLAADDPFWTRAPLPWGHNCRDRKVSRSERDIERMGLTVSKGTEAWAMALPDDGWS